MQHHFVILVPIVINHYSKTENEKVLRTVQKIKNPPGKTHIILDLKKKILFRDRREYSQTGSGHL